MNVKVYHPSGVEVLIPVAAGRADYAALFAQVEAMLPAVLAAGFAARPVAPGEGEGREAVGWVLRKTKDSKRGDVSDQIDVYAAHEAVKFPVLTVYLNDDRDRSLFERASGLEVAKLPEYMGSDKVERGKGAKTDRFIVKAPRPFSVVYVPNPRWKQEEADAAAAAQKMYPVPKRKFVRWEEGPAGK